MQHLFGYGTENLVRFTFVEDDEYSANDYIDMAVKLNTLGVKLDASKLKELTKLAFIQDVEEWSPSAEAPNKEWSPEAREELRLEMEAEK